MFPLLYAGFCTNIVPCSDPKLIYDFRCGHSIQGASEGRKDYTRQGSWLLDSDGRKAVQVRNVRGHMQTKGFERRREPALLGAPRPDTAFGRRRNGRYSVTSRIPSHRE
jgi:hypothetical protein